MANTESKAKIKVNTKLTEPSQYKVIYLNDDVTTMEFVIDSLISHFDYSTENAEEVSNNIHSTGSAIVAILPYEIAEQKGIEVTYDARSNGYPLQIRIESEHK